MVTVQVPFNVVGSIVHGPEVGNVIVSTAAELDEELLDEELEDEELLLEEELLEELEEVLLIHMPEHIPFAMQLPEES